MQAVAAERMSIGLTRLFYKFNELNIIKAEKKSVADVIIIPICEDLTECVKLAAELRSLNVNTEVYLNDKKIKAKMKYANKLAVPYVIVIGDDEIMNKKVKVKNMETGEEKEANLEANEIKRYLI